MKILLLDCETSPMSVYAWSLFKPHISINQIQDTSRTLCVAYKWLGEKKTHFLSEWTHEDMIAQLHELLSEADIVITYNGNRFDLPVLHIARTLCATLATASICQCCTKSSCYTVSPHQPHTSRWICTAPSRLSSASQATS